MFGPVLTGERVRLEPPRHEDAATRCRWFADLEVTRLYTSPGVPSLQQEEESFERSARDESTVLWRVTVEGRLIGSAFLCNIDWLNRYAGSGMMIGERSEWGKGYGSEVVRLRTDFAFRELGLESLGTSSIDTNVGMRRALERSGYRQIGARHHRFLISGAWHDEYQFELLREEWLQRAG